MVVVQNCEKMFWGVTIDTGKRYSQVVKQGFHVSMAALEVGAKKPNENVQIMLQYESSEYLLCTLNTNLLQQPLDLNFASGEQVSFSLNGSGVVHLTGFLIPEEEEPKFDTTFSDSDDSSDDEEIPSLVEISDVSNLDSSTGANAGKRKALLSEKTAKKLKLSESVDDDDSDEDDEDYSEEEEGFSDDFDEDEFDDDEEEDEEIDDESEDDDGDDDEGDLSPAKKDKSKTPAKLSTPASSKKLSLTPITSTLQKNKDQHNVKKEALKSNSVKNTDSTPRLDGKSPKQEVKQEVKPETPSTPNESAKKKKKKKKKNKKEGNLSLNDSSSAPDTPAKTPESTPKKRVVAGGTIVEDLKLGNGPEAKPGKMASVYYVGTLSKSGKRFDSCTEGKPFRFRLNQGEVIKGWDNGVLGMKVGGKRKITVPASQGYGNIKQGPIPPNSTLVFEVELKAVS